MSDSEPIYTSRRRHLRWLLAELVVVVLGILIAFQIDAWNTQRQERRVAMVSLQAIVRDLDLGEIEYQEYRKTTEQTFNGIERILSMLDNDRVYTPTEIVELTDLPPERLWQPTATAFNSLRDTGRLDLIADRELQAELVTYFDTFEPYFLDLRLLGTDLREQFRQVIDRDFELFLGPDFPETTRVSRRLIVPPETWPTDPEFRNVLVLLARRMSFNVQRTDDGLGYIANLRSRIADYIESNER